MLKKILPLATVAVMALGSAASAATIRADVVLDYFDSGAGPIEGPFGSDAANRFPVSVDVTAASDDNDITSLSLPTGSFVTLGFSTGAIFDGTGADIFISEPGANRELADIFVSPDFGATFTFLGQANGGTLTELDLGSINYTGQVNAIRIVGLDNGGGSPGFDVAYVEGLDGSTILGPQGPVTPTNPTTPSAVPLPATGAMFLLALGGLGVFRKFR